MIKLSEVIIPIIAVTAVSLISFQFYITSNVYYLKLSTYYGRTHAFANRLVARIEQLPEFSQGAPVALIGQLPNGYYKDSNYNFSEIINDRGLRKQYIGTSLGAPDSYKLFAFMDFYLGVPMNSATSEQVAEIEMTPQFMQMDCWPAANSVAIINDIITVKLNNSYYINAKYLGDMVYTISTVDSTADNFTYAWYIDAPGGTREFTQWYEASAEITYQFKTKGKYAITLFVRNASGEIVTIQYQNIDVV